MLLLLLMSWSLQNSDRAIKVVKTGELDIRPAEKVGTVFESYPHWSNWEWLATSEPDQTLVTFRGVFSHNTSMELIQTHQYEWELGFKFMHLHSIYGLERDAADDQIIEIHFEVIDGKFSVHSGEFKRQSSENEWHSYPLSDKALLMVIKSLYRPTDPYAMLIKGLPYK